MKFHWALLRWQLRNVLEVNIGYTVMLITVVFLSEQIVAFKESQPFSILFVLHLFFVVALLGNANSGRFQYLYGQGFSRDTLWKHMMLATLLSALFVCSSVAIVIFGGLRSAIQDQLSNYRFPLLATEEHSFVYWMLTAYLITIPVFHYCWLRMSHPTHGQGGGFMLAIFLLVSLASAWWLLQSASIPSRLFWTVASGYIVVAAVQVVVGWKTHQEIEVL